MTDHLVSMAMLAQTGAAPAAKISELITALFAIVGTILLAPYAWRLLEAAFKANGFKPILIIVGIVMAVAFFLGAGPGLIDYAKAEGRTMFPAGGGE